MRLYRKTLKKLASLTALGAGAAALSTENADASVIYSGPMDQKVGWETSKGYGDSWTSPSLPGGAQFQFHKVQSTTSTFNNIHRFYLDAKAAQGSLRFEDFVSSFKLKLLGSTFTILTTILKAVNKGALWSTTRASSHLPVAGRVFTNGIFFFNQNYGLSSFADLYALFQFQNCGAPGNAPCYGWVELGLSIKAGHGPGSTGANGPNLDIRGYAYDDSGTLIPAGYTGPASIPEPTTIELGGLGALVFGAMGLRRWRRLTEARKEQGNEPPPAGGLGRS